MNYQELIIPIVQVVGDEVMRHYRKPMHITQKNNGSFYTEVDLLAQQMLQEKLQILLPGSGYIAEEGEIYDKKKFTWVIDPIDGTRNFVRGMPYFGISVALLEDDELIAAVTYMPAMHDMISAQKGMGTWLNGTKVVLNFDQPNPSGLLLVTSVARIRAKEQISPIKKVLSQVSTGVRFRLAGAAAVDLAYAAVGIYDVVMFENLNWWDAAAGVLLLSESLGHVSDYKKVSINQNSDSLIGGNPFLCRQILEANLL